MTPGLPHPPQPPHDPKSILLDARLGFRSLPPAPGELAAVVDRDRCALTLPRHPSAVRTLAEASGSLGGLRPPSNVAIGPDGSIYLLDKQRLELARFDACDCAFKRIPCFGGAGGAPRQLRNPGGIAIDCGNLYVCDTGLEELAAGPCEDEALQQAKIRGENHRVSVFSMKGFALRGHLLPPTDERPWRPVSVAVDAHGRVWVGDLNGKLHRFTSNGAWERAWPANPAPQHLAIDLRGRVYLVAPGATPSVRVLEPDGISLAAAPSYPEDARAAFPRLGFEVDASGRLFLEPFCDPCSAAKSDPAATLGFDDAGKPVEVKVATAPLYAKAASYRSDALDSHIAQCVWHRVSFCGSLPSGTRLKVRAFAADERLTTAELDALAAWQPCAVADAFDAGTSWDCLVRAVPGRYLWLEVKLESNETATPAIDAMVVEFPRVSLRRYLPAVFGMDPSSADFTDRFLALFDTPLRSIECQVDELARLFDPSSAPARADDPSRPDFLSWLGTWIGVTVDRNWDVATRRRFLKRAGSLFDRRGTPGGLREQLLLLLDFDGHAPCAASPASGDRCLPGPRNCGPIPEPSPPQAPALLLEHFRLRRWLRVGSGRLGDDAVLWGERIVGRTHLGANAQAGVTRLDTSPDPAHDPFLVHANQFSVFVPARCRDSERQRRAIENLIKTESPAGTVGQLEFVEPRFRIGVQSMLGFDAVVGALPQGVTLGETPLGAASILTGPPHLEGGPAIALGKQGRVGTTTVLT